MLFLGRAKHRAVEPSTLSEILQETAKVYPRRVALIFEKVKITYQQLNQQADNFACGLIRLGIKKKEKIGILLGNCPEFVISYFGIINAGAIAVPLNNMLKIDELKFILSDCQAVYLISSLHFKEVVDQLMLRVESLRHIILVGAEGEGAISFSEILKAPISFGLDKAAEPEDVACILYTSGTTGHPKGAMLTHGNLISNVIASTSTIRLTVRDNLICLLPMFHSFAFTVCILMPLYAGSKVTIMESVKPFKRVLRNILRNRVTIFVGIPQMYKVLSEVSLPWIFRPWIVRLLNPVRLCISGADRLPVEVLDSFQKRFRIPLLEGYGLTEASPVVSINPLGGRRKSGSVGLPLPEVMVKVVDDNGKDLSSEETGELLVKGPNVMKGYFNQSKATAQTIKGGWLYTGDMAKIDEDGYIYIVDRKKDMLIVRGLNVYPREIEEVLYSFPKVREAAVVGIDDERRGQIPKAYISLRENTVATEQEIIAYCRERLASYKVPRIVEFRASLPKTITGKVQKKALR